MSGGISDCITHHRQTMQNKQPRATRSHRGFGANSGERSRVIVSMAQIQKSLSAKNNAKALILLVGPPGLEPGTKGL